MKYPLIKCPPFRKFSMRLWLQNGRWKKKMSANQRCPPFRVSANRRENCIMYRTRICNLICKIHIQVFRKWVRVLKYFWPLVTTKFFAFYSRTQIDVRLHCTTCSSHKKSLIEIACLDDLFDSNRIWLEYRNCKPFKRQYFFYLRVSNIETCCSVTQTINNWDL